MIYTDGQSFEGLWESKRQVKGTMVYKNGDVYIGDFDDRNRHDMGELHVKSTGEQKQGRWVNNMLVEKNDSNSSTIASYEDENNYATSIPTFNENALKTKEQETETAETDAEREHTNKRHRSGAY